MSKAVLVMDMPESCDMCDFADDTQPPRYGERTLYCNAPCIGEDVTDYIACRPDWCPLRELPEKNPNNPELGNQAGISQPGVYYTEKGYEVYKRGWNACLDEILK
jgi:hypothetical protein